MNILELDTYDLGDAVKFNDRLNPRLFGPDERLRPEVREQLMAIAEDFQQFLGVKDLELKDITVSGSNAAYTYTPHSDIDLHLVVDLPEADASEVYRELFDAKKYAYNDQHNITIGGYDVELYVQDANKTHHSQGIYSVLNNDWVAVPKRRRPDVDDISVKSKFEDLGHRIEDTIATGDYEKISALADKIKTYRQAGLDAHGEFGPENLAFKILRKQGLIEKLYAARNEAKDRLLSLDERKKKKKKTKYGYGGYWYPGTAYAGQDHPAGTEGGDGGGGGGDGGESIKESAETSDEDILRNFVNFCVKELKIEQMPRVKLRRDPQWPAVHKTFGRYNDDAKTLEVAWGQRHIMDVLRTVAHELTHKHQHEREGHRMGPDAGETGSAYENEANARAGVLMRDYGRLHPEYFAHGQAKQLSGNEIEEGWREKAAGVVAAACIAGTSGCSSTGQIIKTTQDVGRTAQTISKMTRAGVQDEMSQELRNFIRAQGGDPNAQNLSTLYRWQKRMEQSKQTPPQQNESASGYIPTKKQAKDPRFSMALTVDIKPGQVGKEANKLKLKTDRQGQPQIANPNGLFETLMLEYEKFDEKKLFALADEDYSPDEPPGPEFKPTMPRGTVRVDVSDVYDWYKLGQHIANMKGLGKHDFGKGPPSTIISFGDEDEEHKFIGDLEATGLDVTDIDPRDPQQPPGKKIKTDPTYNVDEVIQTPVPKGKDAEQYYKFIVGKAKMGRPLTRAEQDYVKMYQVYRQQKLAEFAPGAQRDDRGPDEEEILRQYAAQWYNGDEDLRVEKLLATMGWEIGQNEDEAGGAFVIRRGDINGDSFISWTDAELSALNEISDELRRSYLGRAGQQVDRRQTRMAQVRDRLNKGYEIYHAEDPTFIVHRFEANTPGEARRYYETFIDSYESDRDFDLQLRRATGLMEAFNAPYPMTWEHSKDSHDALVKLPDGTNLSIMFSKEYMFGNEEDWHVEFWRNNSQEVTGEGDAQRVFATVLNAIQQFIKMEDPERIRFSASKDQEADSRTNLYGSLVRRYANAWGYEVDSSEYGGSTVFNFYKLYEQDLNEDEELDEVKMSPGALEKFATSDAAKGIRAGFEAELIFRDTQGEADEMDPEPDYDADERAYSIQQVIEFFDNDEYGYGLSDRERRRLEDGLDETYMNWRDEKITSDFRNEAEDLIRERLLEETPMSERIHMYLTDSEQMSDKEADKIIAAGVDAPKFTTSKEQQAYAAQNPYYQAYLDALDAAELELDESVEYSVSQQDGYWDEALDDYRDDYSGDDDSFFSDVGLRWMSDIANEFNLDWPVWNMDARGNSGSRDWETIGALLQDAVDMPIKVSTNYHSTTRREGQWIIEPDSSLSPDDPDDEAGLEIVSPPMPLLTAIEKLRAVVDWANDPKTGNAYTNSSTGLHMGVSLPTMKSEDAGEDTGIDYVKLILFMGDKYVQQQFGRTANTYCASALDKLKQNIKGKRSDPAGVVKLLQHGLTELAYKELQKGVGTSKYTSAHVQPGYIEFRSPGGDWLAKADEEIGVLENTMLRFARAMAIAGDPSAERQEYAKKLYKLVTEDNPEYADQLRLFSEFSAGTINKEQLKKQWAETVLQKELPGTGKEEYEVFRRDNKDSPDATVGTLYARDYDDAYDQFLRQYGRDINELDVRIKQPWFDVFDDTGKIVRTIRAKDVDTATDRAQYEFGERWTDAWKIYRRPDNTPEPKASPRAQVAKRIVKPQAPAVGDDEASDWEAVYKPTGRVFDTLAHADTSQALAWRDSVMRNHGFTNVSDIMVRRVGHQQAADARRDSVDLQRNLGVQDVDIDVTQNFEPRRQNYELVSDEDPDRVVHRMNNATADEVRAWIAQQEQGGMPAGFLRTRIVAEAIDPVSGAGAVPPRLDPKNTSKKTVEPTEKVFKNPVKGLPFKSTIGQAISQKDLENMTQQIQVARKLGDSVMEMEDTPPEVLKALDLAAQKNGYRNWADVKANPRSSSAVMTVAKLANTIMRTTGPHHEKLFYKSKTDENFADKKVSGKSRPGRVKRAGASCAGSVTDLRARAKNSSGEKAKMYHWCANMKAGKKK